MKDRCLNNAKTAAEKSSKLPKILTGMKKLLYKRGIID